MIITNEETQRFLFGLNDGEHLIGDLDSSVLQMLYGFGDWWISEEGLSFEVKSDELKKWQNLILLDMMMKAKNDEPIEVILRGLKIAVGRENGNERLLRTLFFIYSVVEDGPKVAADRYLDRLRSDVFLPKLCAAKGWDYETKIRELLLYTMWQTRSIFVSHDYKNPHEEEYEEIVAGLTLELAPRLHGATNMFTAIVDNDLYFERLTASPMRMLDIMQKFERDDLMIAFIAANMDSVAARLCDMRSALEFLITRQPPVRDMRYQLTLHLTKKFLRNSWRVNRSNKDVLYTLLITEAPGECVICYDQIAAEQFAFRCNHCCETFLCIACFQRNKDHSCPICRKTGILDISCDMATYLWEL